MNLGGTRPNARRQRAGLRSTLAIGLTAVLCAALPGVAAAAGPGATSGGPMTPQPSRLAHHVTPAWLAAQMRSLTGGANPSRPSLVSALPASGASLCVGSRPGCFATIQAALDAAHDGDTIRIGPGTYAGGIKITKSIRLVGTDASATVITGGGPVVTVGEYLASSAPTVAISGVTITGGESHSSPMSAHWLGAENVIAAGGGVEILPFADSNGNSAGGATVTITDSVITGNLAAPTATLPDGPVCPGGARCPFAWAKGGGIDNWGALTLVNTTVSDNTAAGLASDANGGGINDWWSGSLTLTHSRVTGNRAFVVAPGGRFAEGGGIFTDQGIALKVTDSVISDNTASLTSTLPYFVDGADPIDMNANGGGIHVGDGSSVMITGTTMRNNVASVDDPNGEPYAFDAALHPGDAALILRDSTIANNRVVARVGSSADVGPSGSALDVIGPSTITNTRIIGNTTLVTSLSGSAWASAAGVYAGDTTPTPILMSNTIISGNLTTASSTSGSVTVSGAGILNDGGLLVIRNSLVTANLGVAHGPSGTAQGAGIWNGSLFDSTPAQLTLDGTTVSLNALIGGAGVTLQGGGLFTAVPITLHRSQITHNLPDDCSGC